MCQRVCAIERGRTREEEVIVMRIGLRSHAAAIRNFDYIHSTFKVVEHTHSLSVDFIGDGWQNNINKKKYVFPLCGSVVWPRWWTWAVLRFDLCCILYNVVVLYIPALYVFERIHSANAHTTYAYVGIRARACVCVSMYRYTAERAVYSGFEALGLASYYRCR